MPNHAHAERSLKTRPPATRLAAPMPAKAPGQVQRVTDRPGVLNAAGVLAMQRSIGNRGAQQALASRTPGPRVQRMTYRVGQDDVTLSTARNVSRPNERQVEAGTEGQPLFREVPEWMSKGLGTNEELKIVGHGDVTTGTISGKYPQEVIEKLIELGLDPDQHKGDINLVVCLSGFAPEDGYVIADMFCWYLRLKGFTNRVIGYNGYVHVYPDGRLVVVPPENQAAFHQAETEANRLVKVDVDKVFIQMVMNENKDMSEYNAWKVKHIAALEAAHKAITDSYVSLAARPNLRREVTPPQIQAPAEKAALLEKYKDGMRALRGRMAAARQAAGAREPTTEASNNAPQPAAASSSSLAPSPKK